MFIDLDNSDVLDQEETPIQLSIESVAEVTLRATVHQMRIKDIDNLNKLCTPYTRSKSTRVVR